MTGRSTHGRSSFETKVLAQYGARRVALGGAAASAKRIKLPSSGGMDKLGEKIKFWLQDFF